MLTRQGNRADAPHPLVLPLARPCIQRMICLPFLVSFLWWGCGLNFKEAREEPLALEMNSWIGQYREDLLRKWGPPTQESRLSNGGSILSYYFVGGKALPPLGDRVVDVPQDCRKDFEATSAGQIITWQYHAAGCS